MGKCFEPHQLEHGASLDFVLVAPEALHARAEGDVVPDVEPGKQRRLLKHHPAVGAGLVDWRAVERQFAAGARLEAGEQVEQGRLAAAGRSEQGNELTVLDLQRDVVERAAPAPCRETSLTWRGTRHCP